MEQYKFVVDTLENMEILYKLIEHPPALTTEEADHYIEGIEGVRTKTLFLCNAKSTSYYLLIMDDVKRLDMKKLGALISAKGIHFCSPERLLKKLQLAPGVVSVFGLLNNTEKDVNVLLDKEMLTERFVSFHANDNTKTVFITTEDLYRFINKCGFEYKVLDL